MSTAQDFSVGWKPETVYKTPVTIDRWADVLGSSTLDWNKQVKQPQGIRPGARMALSSKRTVPLADGGGDIPLELYSRGLGTLFQAAMGAGTSALVSGTTYQQLFTLGDTPPSLTVQVGIPEYDTGSIEAFTYLGCMVEQFELAFPNGDIATMKPTIDAGDLSVATAYAAPSAPAAGSVFQFGGGAIANGTLTAPTSTALASGSTPLAGVRDLTVQVNRNIDTGRFNFNGAGRKDKPVIGLTQVTGTANIEFRGSTFRDAVLNETPMPLVLTMTTANALSTGFETFQLVLPECKFNGAMPKPNGTDSIVVPLAFEALENASGQRLWIATRTADSAL